MEFFFSNPHVVICLSKHHHQMALDIFLLSLSYDSSYVALKSDLSIFSTQLIADLLIFSTQLKPV